MLFGLSPPWDWKLWRLGGQGMIHGEPDGGYRAQPIRFRVIGRGSVSRCARDADGGNISHSI